MTKRSVPHTACAVCGHVVNQRVNSFGEVWFHTLKGDDHPVVPVPVESINTIIMCDFCLAPNGRWVLPAEDYEAVPGHNSVGDWATCDVCAGYINDDAWDALTDHAHAAAERRRGIRGSVDRRALAVFYTQLRAHVTGPVRLQRPR